jgi:hypothetical protein
MTNRTFYHDGFRDTQNGLEATPPSNKVAAGVYIVGEYMAGYEDACEAMQAVKLN